MIDAHSPLIDEVASWEGVTLEEGRFSSTRFMVGRRELGHLHGDTILDLPLPPKVKAELIERGDARQHRWTRPESGWVTVEVVGAAGREHALALLRERYEHALAKRAARAG